MPAMISDAELAILRADSLPAMPQTATILRPTRTATAGGYSQVFAQVATHIVSAEVRAAFPNLAPGTTPCRLSASVLSGGNEQDAAAQQAGIMAYTLTVPADTDITHNDRIQVDTRTFEVAAGKTIASWNMSDSWTLTEVQR